MKKKKTFHLVKGYIKNWSHNERYNGPFNGIDQEEGKLK